MNSKTQQDRHAKATAAFANFRNIFIELENHGGGNVYVILYLENVFCALIPVLFVVSFVVFLVVYMIPGGPATAILGLEASADQINALNAQSLVLTDHFLCSMVTGSSMYFRETGGIHSFYMSL